MPCSSEGSPSPYSKKRYISVIYAPFPTKISSISLRAGLCQKVLKILIPPEGRPTLPCNNSVVSQSITTRFLQNFQKLVYYQDKEE